ncbi:MAG: tyrosine-type recombinase/integrase [Anaerolineae bacterium]|nr:tyrosine-type recombinase/integrase [Anaerolineae bacterium]
MLEQHLANFLDHLTQVRRYSANTVVAYQNDLSQFLQYLGVTPTLEALSIAQVKGYIETLQAEGYASSTIARKVAALKTFLSYLHSVGLLENAMADQIETPRVQRRVQQTLSREEVERLLAVPAASDDARSLRNRVLLELLYTTDLRVNELVDLSLDDIQKEGLRVRRHNGQRLVRLDDPTCTLLRHYLDQGYPDLVSEEVETRALFLNHRGSPLSRQGLWLIIKTCAEAAGLPTTVTPHILRRSFDYHQQQRAGEEAS